MSAFGAIVDAALKAYARRWPLYLAFAATSTLLQAILTVGLHLGETTQLAISAVLDGFVIAVATIDVVATSLDETPSVQRLLRAALLRWPIVALASLLAAFLQAILAIAVFGPPESTAYGFFIVPAIAMIGALGIPPAIAAVETGMPLVALPLYSIVKGLWLSSGWPNLGRVALAGGCLIPAMMLGQILITEFTRRGHPIAATVANIAVDAFTIAAYSTLFAGLYLDLVARTRDRVR